MGMSRLIDPLRCLSCGGRLGYRSNAADSRLPDLGPDGKLRCETCDREYPIVGGTARMLDPAARISCWSSIRARARC